MMITKSMTFKDVPTNTIVKPKPISQIQLKLRKSYSGEPKEIPTVKEADPIVYSLKPNKYSIPHDVFVIEIMQTMKSNHSDRIKHTVLQLTSSQRNQRKTYIDKLRLFIVCEDLSYAIVSHSIYLMDVLISKNAFIPMEHIFIGSMLLGIKYYSIDTRLLLLRRVQRFMKESSGIGYTIDELNQIEINCLMTLEYKLNWVHASHFIQLLLVNGILFNIDTSNSNNKTIGNINTVTATTSIYDLVNRIMEVLYEGDKYFAFDSFHLACACVATARNISGYTPWAATLEKVFGIGFIQFEYCYEFVKENYTVQEPKHNVTRNHNCNYDQHQDHTPIKQQYERKVVTSITKRQDRDIDICTSSLNSILKTETKEVTKHKGIYFKSKSKSIEISKDQLDDFNYTQRQFGHKQSNKQLGVIKENDINSTNDNSFGTMTDMNQNRAAVGAASSNAQYFKNKEVNANVNATLTNSSTIQGRNGVISLNKSSSIIVKKLNFNQIEEHCIQRLKKAQMKQSDSNISYTLRKQCNSSTIDNQFEVKKPNQINFIKHIHNKSMINNSIDKSYLTGIKRLLKENKHTRLFDNFEVVKKNDMTFCASRNENQ